MYNFVFVELIVIIAYLISISLKQMPYFYFLLENRFRI